MNKSTPLLILGVMFSFIAVVLAVNAKESLLEALFFHVVGGLLIFYAIYIEVRNGNK
jgi:hypothetical protein